MSNSHLLPEEDETTPLLPNSDWKTLLPCISEPTIDAHTSELIDFKHSFYGADSANDNVPVPVIAFELLVILYHLTLPGYHDDIKPRLSRMSQSHFFELVSEIKAGGDSERQKKFGAFLVYKFKVDSSSARHLCILDLLNHVEIPQEIITSTLLSQSITTLWKTGFSGKTFTLDVSRVQRLDNIIRSPRTLHCVHLISHVLYLLSLSALVLYPPSGLFGSSQEPITVVIIAWIILYSVSMIVFYFKFSTVILHATAIISIFWNFQPDSLSHTLLLTILSIQIIQMHLSQFPSHLLLFNPQTFLPISTFFSGCFRYCLFPSLAFLLPMIIVFLVLLSFSISDVLILSLSAGSFTASPLSVRTGFLIFLTLSVVMLVSLFWALVVRFSSSSNTALGSPHWDKLGTENGIVARRFLIQAILKYSASVDGLMPLTYPPPFNIVEYVLVPISKRTFSQIDVRLWYVTVGPLAFVVAGLWLWGNVNT